MRRIAIYLVFLVILVFIFLTVVYFTRNQPLQRSSQTPQATRVEETATIPIASTLTPEERGEAIATPLPTSQDLNVTVVESVVTQTIEPTMSPDTPSPTESPIPITVLPPEGPASPTNLHAESVCAAPVGVDIFFTWRPGSGVAAQQLDLSIFDNDFFYGTYRSTELLPGEASSFTWTGLGDGVFYVWRVRSLVDGSWVPSQTANIETQICGGDGISP